MKNKHSFIIILLTCLLVLSSLFSASVLSKNEVASDELEITSIEKETAGFKITFTNIGDTYLRGIQFNISVVGGWIKPVDFHYDEMLFDCNCTDVLEPGEELIISTKDFEMLMSFGILEVNVDVSSFAIGSLHAEQRAFIIGTFIIML